MPEPQTDRFVWCDLETFGLKPATDPILEIGFKITDRELNVVDDFQVALWETPWYDSLYSELKALEHAGVNTFVYDMHQQSGLWDECLSVGLPPHEAKERTLDWLNGHGVGKGDPLCGSTIHFDKSFFEMWMPDVADLFSYRVIDVSSIKELCMRLNPTVYARIDSETTQRKLHRSLADIDDTLGELDWYVKNFLHAQPSA